MAEIDVSVFNDVRPDTSKFGIKNDFNSELFLGDVMKSAVMDPHAAATHVPDGSSAAQPISVTVNITIGDTQVPVKVTAENILGLCLVRYLNNGWDGANELWGNVITALDIIQIPILRSSPLSMPTQKQALLLAVGKAVTELHRLVQESIVDVALKAHDLAVEQRKMALTRFESEELRYGLSNAQWRMPRSTNEPDDLGKLVAALRDLLAKEKKFNDTTQSVRLVIDDPWGSPFDTHLPEKLQERDQTSAIFTDALLKATEIHPFISGMLAHVDRKLALNPTDYADDVLISAVNKYLTTSQIMLKSALPVRYPVEELQAAMNTAVMRMRPDIETLYGNIETPELRAQMWAEQTNSAQRFDALSSERILSRLLENKQKEAARLVEDDEQFVVAMFHYQVIANLMRALTLRNDINVANMKNQEKVHQKKTAPLSAASGALDLLALAGVAIGFFFPPSLLVEAAIGLASGTATALGLGTLLGDAITIYAGTSAKNESIDTKILISLLANDQATVARNIADRPNLLAIAGEVGTNFAIFAAIGKVSKTADISLRVLFDKLAIEDAVATYAGENHY